MKLTASLISAVALHAAAAVSRKTGSGCNVEGNLFQLEGFGKVHPNDTDNALSQINVSPWGDLGTDTLAIMDTYNGGMVSQTAVFYINTDNNRLVVLDPFAQLRASIGYTDAAEGGELKFTFYNDTSRSYYFPSFGINDKGYLTADGKSDVFTYCESNSTHALEGSIAIGPVDGKKCQPLDYIDLYPVTSELSIE